MCDGVPFPIFFIFQPMKIVEWQKRISHEIAERPWKSTHSILTILLSVTICLTSKWKIIISQSHHSMIRICISLKLRKLKWFSLFAFSVCMEIFSALGGLIGSTSLYSSNVQIYWKTHQMNNELRSMVLIVNAVFFWLMASLKWTVVLLQGFNFTRKFVCIRYAVNPPDSVVNGRELCITKPSFSWSHISIIQIYTRTLVAD